MIETRKYVEKINARWLLLIDREYETLAFIFPDEKKTPLMTVCENS